MSKAFFLYGCETWNVIKRPTRDLQTFVNRCLMQIFLVFWPNLISNEELWRRTRKNISGSANKPAEMDVNRTCTDKEPFCLKQTLSWNPQRKPSRSRRRIIEQKDLERGQTNSSRVRWLCFVELPCSELEYKEVTCRTSGCRGVRQAVTVSQGICRWLYYSICNSVPKCSRHYSWTP